MKNWAYWVKGFAVAFVSGAVSAVPLIIVDPAHFHGWKHLGSACASFGLVSGSMYLTKPPTKVPEQDSVRVTPERMGL